MMPKVEPMPGLDGLRAVACLMVFAVHFGQKTQLQGRWGSFDLARLLDNGNTGVALFFALSAFLLGLPFWQSMRQHQPQPDAARFYLLRLARVAPAYYLCMAALVLGNRQWEEEGWLRDVLLHALFVANIDASTTLSINPPFWTLAVEVQFYLLLPGLFLLLRSSDVKRAAWACLVGAVLSYGAHAGLTSAGVLPEMVTTYSLLAHLPHFLMGLATGAWWSLRGQGRGVGPVGSCWVPAVLLVLVLATPLDDLLQWPHARYNLPIVPALLCWLIVLAAQPGAGRRGLASAPLRVLGALSFGIYLVHLPVLNLLARTFPLFGLDPQRDWALYGATGLVTSVVLASLSYGLVERPVRRAVRRLAAAEGSSAP